MKEFKFSKPYTGILAEPIEKKKYKMKLLLDIETAYQEIFKETHDKFLLLFDHYEIKKGDYESLAFRLAISHVPGMQLVDEIIKPGRRLEWDYLKYLKLEADLLALEKEGKTLHAACKILAQEEKYFERYGEYKENYMTLYRKILDYKSQNNEFSVVRQFILKAREMMGVEAANDLLLKSFSLKHSAEKEK